MTFAAKTRVPVEQTRAEIERTLTKYGAKSFAYAMEPGRAIIMFEANDRRIRFDLPLPTEENERGAQARRQRWRALLLCIKAKLESVEGKIESFEEAFLSHVVMPGGVTMGVHATKAIKEAYASGHMVPLLPPPQVS